MAGSTLTLTQTLHRYAVKRRRHVWQLGFGRAAAAALLLLLAFVYLDVLLMLPAFLRLAMTAGFGALVVGTVLTTYRRYTRTPSEDRMVARLVEEGNPDLDNDLINAVEFDDALSRGVSPDVSAELMGQEIAIASGKLAAVSRVDTLKPPSFGKEMRALGGVAAATVLLLFLFPSVFAAVLPRFFDPYGDHPPYSPTRLVLDPAGAIVDYGDSLQIRARAEGRPPGRLTLALRDLSGNPLAELPMAEAGDGLFALTVENIRDDFLYRVEMPRGWSKSERVRLSKAPRFDSASVTYDYPAYTRLPRKTRLLGEPAVVAAYPGTRATLSFTSNRPLKGGPLTVGEVVADLMPGDSENVVNGAFELRAPGAFSARLVDIEGNESPRAFSGAIEITPDNRPAIEIVSPGKHSFATPDARVPIVVEARDDLGLTNVTLYRSLNESPDAAKPLFTGDGAETLANLIEPLDLGDLGVRPGDMIDYYAAATDSLPETPQTAATPSFRIAIISQDEFRQFMQEEMSASDLKAKYDDMAGRIGEIADRQESLKEQTKALREKLEHQGAISESEQQELGATADAQAKLAEAAEALAKALRQEADQPAIFDIESEYKKLLEDFAQRLEQAKEHMEGGAKELRQPAQDTPTDPAKHLAGAESRQQQALEELGRAAQDFRETIQQANQDIERIFELMEDTEQFKQLYEAQQHLERQARSFREVREPNLTQQVRLKELGETERTIREALGRLREQLREHAAKIQPDYPQVAEDALEISDQIERKNVEKLMESASAELNDARASEGHARAREALEQMESLIEFTQPSQGQGAAAQCELRLRIQMGLDPGNTMSQLGRGMRPGGSPSRGPMGMLGQGASGAAGSSAAFDVYGADMFGRHSDEERAGSTRRTLASQGRPADPEPLSGSIEELSAPAKSDLDLHTVGAERVLEKYRDLIEAYFRGMAEERPS